MWTDTTRAQYARAELALPSDLNDAEWAVLEPFFPVASHVGRPRKWPMRPIVEAICYLLRGGLPWRMLPPCFPPVSTMRRWFYLWRDNGRGNRLCNTLCKACRVAAIAQDDHNHQHRRFFWMYQQGQAGPADLGPFLGTDHQGRGLGGVQTQLARNCVQICADPARQPCEL